MGFVPLDQVAAEPRRTRSGFIPLSEISTDEPATERRGFIPVDDIESGPSLMQRAAIAAEPYVVPAAKTVQAVASGYPVLEAGANLATMGVALPVAGIAGIGAAASKALGLTDAEPGDVVRAVGGALTYQPKTRLGQHLTSAVTYPFELLAEAGQGAGNRVLDATGSPLLATVVDTAIQAAPMAIAPVVKGARAVREKFRAPVEDVKATPGEAAPEPAPTAEPRAAAPQPAAEPTPAAASRGVMPAAEPRGFIPIEEVANAATTKHNEARAQRLADSDQALYGAGAQGLDEVRRGGDQGLPGVDGELRAVPDGYGASDNAAALAGQAGSTGELRAGQLRVDRAATARTSPDILPEGEYLRPDGDGSGSGALNRSEADYRAAQNGERIPTGEPASREASSQVEMADAQRRDPAATAMGAADRPAVAGAVVSDQERMAGGTGADAQAIPQPRAARYALIESDDLKPSHNVDMRPTPDHPENFKRPDWTRHDAEQRVQGIVREFEPARLAEAADDAGGAPIVASDGVVEAGNARTIALQRIYQANGQKAENYRQMLRENAESYGLDPAQIDGMKKPVLVRLPDEPAPRQPSGSPLSNESGSQWVAFPPEARALGIPRAEMPQIKGDHRGAFIQYLSGKGVTHKNIEVPADSIKPTQAEFSPEKVKAWAKAGDSDRSVLVSSDGYVLDGHHQWMASRISGEPVKAIRLDAPISDLLKLSNEFPSVKRAEGTAKVQDMAGPVQNSFAPGANYAAFINDARAPASTVKSVADLPVPKRREAIIGDLEKALNTTVYEGRVKGKNRLGFFRPAVSEVRIKRANDIETTAHEVAHLIDKRIPAISNTWRSDKALREELKSVSYDQKSASEGFAEGVRLFLTQPEVLEARAPKVHAWLESFAQNHEYGPALRKAQEQMTGWFGQDALNRARSKIGAEKGIFTKKPVAEYLDGFWDKFRQSTVDDLHGIYRMEREMTGKINPVGPYESARLSRASASIADGAVRFGYPEKKPDGSFAWKGQGLEDILKPVAASMDDALLYFVGRSSRELMAQGREHLFTAGEIDGMLRLRTPERDKAFADYQAWNKGILDFAQAQGVINPETRVLWKRTQYLPFHRVEQPGGLKGKPGDWSGIQALTGGTTNIKDVLGNMIGNSAMLLDKAVKNEARLKVAKLSQKDGGGKFMVKIDTESRPVKISGDQVIDAMLKRYGIGIDGPAPAFFDFLIKGQPPAGKNVVAALQRGKPVWFEVGDPILYRALSAIDRPVQSEVVKWLGMPKRIGQASITAVPDFWIANIARDTIMGSVMSRAGFRPILDSLDGMRMRMTSDPIYKEWVANGGGLSSIYLDEAKFRTKLEKFYTRQGIDYRTVLDAPGKLLNMVETLGDAFESSTRLGEYKRAVARGENPRHAAYLARDVSTDFAMKGDSKALGFMYDTIMFLRPALVSWDRFYRGIAHDPNKGAIAAKTGIVALASAGLYLLNKDDPRYADLPDWDRDANWHFFVGDQHFRSPKIWEIGAVASAAERSVEKIMAADPAGLGKDFARILANTFSVNLMPQIISPLAEQAANRNSFTKAPIETPGMENAQPFLRSKPGTSETMKALGMATRDLPESMQVNPARAEALLRGYFNTFAVYGLMLTDKTLAGDNAPAMRADEMPVMRRFYANEPAKHTKYETMFYDLLQESKRLRGTMRELDDMNLRGYADDKEASPLSGEAKPLERAAKNLGVINKDSEAVRRDQSTTPAEKRQKLDTLTVERNDLLKAAVTASQEARKQKALTPADVARQGIFQK